MGTSALGEEAIWTSEAPSYEEILSSAAPVYLGPPVRNNVAIATQRLIPRSFSAALAARSGVGIRDLLSFGMWRETARALGITLVIGPDGSVSPLNRLLPSPSKKKPTAPPPVGLAMMVQDEERRLGRCLASVADWISEIVIVDGGSRDGTRDVAASFGARVIERPFDNDYAAQRNIGLQAIRTPWVLVLDADEILSPELPGILDHVASSGEADSAHIHILNLLGDEKAPWHWPDRKLRFFRSGHLMAGRIHEKAEGLSQTAYLPLSGPFILHNKSLSEQWDRETQYFEIDPSYYSEQDARRILRWKSRDDDVPELELE